jgi:hypothetical protein
MIYIFLLGVGIGVILTILAINWIDKEIEKQIDDENKGY